MALSNLSPTYSTAPKRRHWGRWLFVLLLLALLLLAAALSIPWIALNTRFGLDRIAEPALSRYLRVPIRIGSSSWLLGGHVHLAGLSVGPAATPIAEVSQVDLVFHPGTMVKNGGNLDLESLSVAEPKIKLLVVDHKLANVPPGFVKRLVALLPRFKGADRLVVDQLSLEATVNDKRQFAWSSVHVEGRDIRAGQAATLQYKTRVEVSNDDSFADEKSAPTPILGYGTKGEVTAKLRGDWSAESFTVKAVVDENTGVIDGRELKGIRGQIDLAGTMPDKTQVKVISGEIAITKAKGEESFHTSVTGDYDFAKGSGDADLHARAHDNFFVDLLFNKKKFNFDHDDFQMEIALSSTEHGKIVHMASDGEIKNFNLKTKEAPTGLLKKLHIVFNVDGTLDQIKRVAAMTKFSLQLIETDKTVGSVALDHPVSIALDEDSKGEPGESDAKVTIALNEFDITPVATLIPLAQRSILQWKLKEAITSFNGQLEVTDEGRKSHLTGIGSMRQLEATTIAGKVSQANLNWGIDAIAHGFNRFDIAQSSFSLQQPSGFVGSVQYSGKVDFAKWIGEVKGVAQADLPPLLQGVENAQFTSGTGNGQFTLAMTGPNQRWLDFDGRVANLGFATSVFPNPLALKDLELHLKGTLDTKGDLNTWSGVYASAKIKDLHVGKMTSEGQVDVSKGQATASLNLIEVSAPLAKPVGTALTGPAPVGKDYKDSPLAPWLAAVTPTARPISANTNLHLSWTPEGIYTLDELKLALQPEEHPRNNAVVHGTLDFTASSPKIDLDVKADELDLVSLLPYAPGLPNLAKYATTIAPFPGQLKLALGFESLDLGVIGIRRGDVKVEWDQRAFKATPRFDPGEGEARAEISRNFDGDRWDIFFKASDADFGHMLRGVSKTTAVTVPGRMNTEARISIPAAQNVDFQTTMDCTYKIDWHPTSLEDNPTLKAQTIMLSKKLSNAPIVGVPIETLVSAGKIKNGQLTFDPETTRLHAATYETQYEGSVNIVKNTVNVDMRYKVTEALSHKMGALGLLVRIAGDHDDGWIELPIHATATGPSMNPEVKVHL